MGAPAASGLAGAVLVGGASRRMGRDKAAMPWGDTTMGERVVAVLRSAGCDPVIAVGGRADAHGGLGVSLEPDHFPGEGPLGGIVTALRTLTTPYVAIVACDMPWLEASVITSLRDACSTGEVDVAMARTTRIEPLLAVWSTTALAAVEQAFQHGERAVYAVVDRLRVTAVDVPAAVARNVNRPTDVPWPSQ